MSAAFAAADWGTSSFRLWLFDAAGTVVTIGNRSIAIGPRLTL